MAREVKARSWVFTYHYPETVEEARVEVEALNDGSCVYYCYGEEVCPSTGRAHLQGFVRFRNAKRFATLKNKFPSWHFEVAKGTGNQNILYTSKTRPEDENAGKTPGDVENGCQPWTEWGDRPDDAGYLKGWLYTLDTFKEEFDRRKQKMESDILRDLCLDLFDYFEELDYDTFGGFEEPEVEDMQVEEPSKKKIKIV